MNGCDQHVYIWDLLPWAQPLDSEANDSILYLNHTNDREFTQGPAGYSSVELYNAEAVELIGAEETDFFRSEFDAKVGSTI